MDVLGVVCIPWWLLAPTLLLVGYYIYTTWHFNLFKRAGIPGPSPVPVWGTALPFLKDGILVDDMRVVRKYGKIAGGFMGRTPVLYVSDPDMIKKVLVTEFNVLSNRAFPDFKEPVVKRTLTMLKNEHWKHVRGLLSPAFSVNKLKMMSGELNRCAAQLTRNLEQHVHAGSEFEVKEVVGSFTMDVIASTAFGLRSNAQVQQDSDLVKYAKKVFENTAVRPALFLLFFFPHVIYLLRLFGAKFMDKEVVGYFCAVVKETIIKRKESNITQNDLLGLMLESRVDDPICGEWNKDGLTEEEILASSFTFFLGGYDTTASTLTFLIHSLVINPECQQKVVDEIIENIGEQEEVTYEALTKLTYLQMCIDECLRLYPPGVRLDRLVERDSILNGIPLVRGMQIIIPAFALHRDPDFWPQPDHFDPNRFLPQNVAKRHPYTYIPFSQGPRNCIGMRLALLEIKLVMVHLLRRFKFVKSDRTEDPIKLKKSTFFIQAENGVWVKVESRQM